MSGFNHFYMCKFERSPLMSLVDKIVEYYRITESATSKEIKVERAKLTAWRESNGFSSDDYQRAKKIASGIRY